MAKVIIPTPLRGFTENQSTVEVESTNVLDAIVELSQKYPKLRQNILDEEGNIRQFVRIYVDEDDIQTLDNEKTTIQPNTIVSIIPAIAGGCCC